MQLIGLCAGSGTARLGGWRSGRLVEQRRGRGHGERPGSGDGGQQRKRFDHGAIGQCLCERPVSVMQSAGSVVIEPYMATLMSLGETVQLTATVLDQNGQPVAGAEVTWSSSDAKVATVSGQGLVTAVGNGSVSITVRSGSTSTSVPVSVMQSAGSIVVEPSTATLMSLGETVQLTATVLDGNGHPVTVAEVDWSTSDASVATVSRQGLVTAISNGSVIITARSGSASASVPVTVMDNSRDREALIVFYNSTSGPNWTVSTNWLSGEPLDSWYGVTTNAVGRVTDMSLLKNGLSGSIPPELGQLHKLGTLELQANALEGAIPQELGQLHNLRFLYLHANNLTGTIPQELGQLRNIEKLYLSNNQLTGAIPSELGQLRNLNDLWLVSNQLTGTIPPVLGQLRNLKGLVLADNRLTGTIPPELGQLQNLEVLNLDGNGQLTGPLPETLTRLANLSRLSLGGTQVCVPPTPLFQTWLEGIENRFGISSCPSSERDALIALYESTDGPNWTNSTNWLSFAPLGEWHGVTTDTEGRVTRLSLSDNNMSGSLTGQLGNLVALETLDLSSNMGLAGPVPLAFIDLDLNTLYLEGTQLCAPLTSGFQAWLGGIPRRSVADCGDIRGEFYLLAALYHGTNGPNWTNNTNWLSGEPFGTWYGVRTNAQGEVISLDLERNNLVGTVPPELGQLANLRDLNLGANALSGVIPLELGQLQNLETLDLWYNQLTGTIPTELSQLHNLTHLKLEQNKLDGVIPQEIGHLTELSVLDLGYNRLTGEIPMELGQLRNLIELTLRANSLSGVIPSELGQLRNLSVLNLQKNRLTGAIPPEFGQLGSLVYLRLHANQLAGTIPPELGQLQKLEYLDLANTQIGGAIPPELGQLSSLRTLYLYLNKLTGVIPSELGLLRSLSRLWLHENELTGAIPPELGQLQSLTRLHLDSNRLTGNIPWEIGKLRKLERLGLSFNRLSGNVPPTFGDLINLRVLNLTGNMDLSGVLPLALTSMTLDELYLGDTRLCAPPVDTFQEWLRTIPVGRVAACDREVGRSKAYLTQASQSLAHPVPLVAGEDALLRVFITSPAIEDVVMPNVRATFYLSGAEVHSVDIPGQRTHVPTQIHEGDLASSANVLVPGSVITPGLEMVIEIDPDGLLVSSPNVAGRLPPKGRIAVDVWEMPPFELTMVPFLWEDDPDWAIVTRVEGLSSDSDLFRYTRDLLPVGDFILNVHQPVWISVDPVGGNASEVSRLTGLISTLEGASGHYMGILRGEIGGFGGRAESPGTKSISKLEGYTIAHELGHNLSLGHAPCGVSGSDPNYPYPDGSIGAWGYDFLTDMLVPPDISDLMSYCRPQWISDYNFTKALRYRVSQEQQAPMAAAFAPSERGLLLWGGVNEDGELVLEPSFAVDAPASLPTLEGPYRIVGEDAGGSTVFNLRFGMAEIDHMEGGSFAFILPVRPDWPRRLSRITLSGPEGVVTVGDEDDRSAALLLDPADGRVRGILRDWPGAGTSVQAARRTVPEPGLEIVISRGVPDRDDW